MNEEMLFSLSLSLVGALFGILTIVVGWIGSNVIKRLDILAEKLTAVAGELHDRINNLDTRLVRVETQIDRRPG
jgi:hypothetical protein